MKYVAYREIAKVLVNGHIRLLIKYRCGWKESEGVNKSWFVVRYGHS